MARGKDRSDLEKGTKTAQLASVSITTVTKVTPALRSVGRTVVNRGGSRGPKHIFSEGDACALVIYKEKRNCSSVH